MTGFSTLADFKVINIRKGYKMIRERIKMLKDLMKKNGIDVYMIPTSDYHGSEYVSEYFETRKFMSGFTGSAGTMVVSETEAVLFTDGRYFIQAEKELNGSGIKLMKMGEKGVPGLNDYIAACVPECGTVGFDGKVVNAKTGNEIEEVLKNRNAKVVYDKDLVGEIWEDRPEIKFTESFYLDEKFSGETPESKIAKVRDVLKEENADGFVLTSLDDIAWLFNMRANDVECNPVAMAYAFITQEDIILYAGTQMPERLKETKVIIKDYFEIYNDMENVRGTTIADFEKVNFAIVKMLGENGKVVNMLNPTTTMKAVKNEVEIANLKRCHIKDGVAVTKFMYWLKNNVGKTKITEISASDYLENLRREQEGFIELSFETISAYKSNAAMMHYSADENSNATLEPEGMLLVDSGGQYYEGTTDITRTFILGPVSDEIKKHYTLVAKSMLNLANAKFLYGCTGLNLDILARGPLWQIGIDYKCGTGHGVGYLLNVHEGPNGFRWKHVPERNDGAVLEAGMITTDEPGVYIEGSHGIRIENELLCKEDENNSDGQFMRFEPITFAPIDLDGIDIKYLNEDDRKMLNNYHKKVYETISPYLNKEEKNWLAEYTREV